MASIPNFGNVAFMPLDAAPTSGSAQPWLTPEGIAVKPAYGADDLAGLDFLDTYPGIPPYLRGPYPTMYRGRTWTMRQIAGFGQAHETNARFRYLIDQGQTGLMKQFEIKFHAARVEDVAYVIRQLYAEKMNQNPNTTAGGGRALFAAALTAGVNRNVASKGPYR